MSELKIELVTDVVCPWCYLGWHRLKRALALRPDVTAKIVWRPYMLRPDMPEEGMDYREYMGAKFSDEKRKTAHENLAELGKKVGIDFRFDDIARAVNTSAAHRLILWAQAEGKLDAVAEGVMRAYFTEGKNIGDKEILAGIGAAAGMDREAILTKFAEGADADTVAQSSEAARAKGIHGVPFYIMGAGGVTVEGSKIPENLALAIDEAQAKAA
ncbi:MAG: disulfide bond formation protein DsbA [Alphaproteobacteria bacterium]|nr:disulfide bond formation protein DsbA [Alphaproteobacteria bacterium]